MTRRNWIKIYPEGFLRRTLFKELIPAERWVWIGFLCLAGDSAIDGKICLTEDMGYTDEQIAKLLDTDINLLRMSKKKMIKFEKISVDKNNAIQILNWNIYQSEYRRQRDYREEYKKRLQREVTTGSDNEKLHIDRDIDKDKIKKDINIYKDIFDYWNKKKIIIHRNLDKATESKINAKLKDYTADEIKDAIHIYSEILKSDEHWFSYKWTLKDFLQRGLEKFIDADIADENYKGKRG